MTERTPWREMLAASARLGVTPGAFWRLSIKEWRAMTPKPRVSVLQRKAFDALAARFPDKV